MLTLRGQITPAVPNEEVIVYWSSNGASWAVLTTTMTQSNGKFEYTWKPATSGFIDMLAVRASWTGNQQYAGTTSQTQSSTILSFLLLIAIIVPVVVIVVSIVAVAVRRRKTKPPAAAGPTNAIPFPEQQTQ
jgi:subtilase family serine protease